MLTGERYGLNFKLCPEMHFFYHFKDISLILTFLGPLHVDLLKIKRLFLKIRSYLDFSLNKQLLNIQIKFINQIKLIFSLRLTIM